MGQHNWHDPEIVQQLDKNTLPFELPAKFANKDILVMRNLSHPYLVIIYDVAEDVHYYFEEAG